MINFLFFFTVLFFFLGAEIWMIWLHKNISVNLQNNSMSGLSLIENHQNHFYTSNNYTLFFKRCIMYLWWGMTAVEIFLLWKCDYDFNICMIFYPIYFIKSSQYASKNEIRNFFIFILFFCVALFFSPHNIINVLFICLNNIVLNPVIEDIYITSLYVLIFLWIQKNILHFILNTHITKEPQRTTITQLVFLMKILWNIVGVALILFINFGPKEVIFLLSEFMDFYFISAYCETFYMLGSSFLLFLFLNLSISIIKNIYNKICTLIQKDNSIKNQWGYVSSSNFVTYPYVLLKKGYRSWMIMTLLSLLLVQHTMGCFSFFEPISQLEVIIYHPLRLVPYGLLFFMWLSRSLILNTFSFKTIYLFTWYTIIGHLFITYISWIFLPSLKLDNVIFIDSDYIFGFSVCLIFLLWLFVRICLHETWVILNTKERKIKALRDSFFTE